jgi:hypothetical protein
MEVSGSNYRDLETENFQPSSNWRWSGSGNGGGGDESDGVGSTGPDHQQPKIDPRRRLFCGGRASSKTPSGRFRRRQSFRRWLPRARVFARPASSGVNAVCRTAACPKKNEVGDL